VATLSASGLVRVPVERLVRALAPTRILLFGSYAKSSQQQGSDVDLLVVTATQVDAAGTKRARQLVASNFPPVDLVFCTEADVEGAAGNPSPFLMSILEHGVLLYERVR
jgi:predicted nucleotidyltransferase